MLIIEQVAEFNFLGLTLDELLDWKCHINKLSNKISQCMGILNRLKRFLPIQTKVLIYNSGTFTFKFWHTSMGL